MDTHDLVVTLFVVATSIGALPIGITITGSKSEATYTSAFKLLESLSVEIDEASKLNPSIGMTDHDDALRNAIQNVWPSVTLLLCLFHVLQAVWRFLISKPSGLTKDSRQEFFAKFKKCVYCDCSDMGQQLKADFFGLSSMNDNCKRYFNTLWSCSNDWIKAYRSNITTRGHDTNNYCEISVRLFKEDVMHRVKARSLGQLLTILTVDVDNFYSSSLLDASHSRKNLSHLYFKSSKAFQKANDIPESCFTNIHENQYHCTSQKTADITYAVDMTSQTCTCTQGLTGKVCKHLLRCSELFLIPLLQLPPETATSRQQYAIIAHGKSEPLTFYADSNEIVHECALETICESDNIVSFTFIIFAPFSFYF